MTNKTKKRTFDVVRKYSDNILDLANIRISDNVRLNKSKFLVLANQLWNLKTSENCLNKLNMLDCTRIAVMLDSYLNTCYEVYNIKSFVLYDETSYFLTIKCEMPYKNICEDSAKEFYNELIKIFNEYNLYFGLDDKEFDNVYLSETLLFNVWSKRYE